MGHYFFFSYARADYDNHVKKLFDELSQQIRRHTGDKVDEVIGFRDNLHIRFGAEWESALMSALSDSATFVALCSPSYFRSEQCGREWTHFTQRMEAYRGNRPPAMLPLIWVRNTRLPEVVQRVQYASEELGSRFTQSGLFNWVRKDGLRRSDFAESLAEQIIDTKQRYKLPPLDPDARFESVENAFAGYDALPAPGPDAYHAAPVVPRQRTSSENRTGPPGSTKNAAPPLVRFVIAAGTKDEMSPVRQNTDYYAADDVSQWAPFSEAQPPVLLRMVEEVARKAAFWTRTDTIEELADRGDHFQIVVLLLDAWFARLPRAEQARRFTDSAAPSDAVLVPVNPADRETWQEWPAVLRDEVLRLLAPYWKLVGDRRPLPLPISEPADLPKLLEQALTEAHGTLFSTATVRRVLKGDEPPYLAGPIR